MISSTIPPSIARGEPAGSLQVLLGELGLQQRLLLIRHGRDLAAVQDPHRGDRTHDVDLRLRPGQHVGGAERPAVHGDVRAAVGLAGDERDPRNRRGRERVQQLRPAAHDAVPLLAGAGQVARARRRRPAAAPRTRRTCARSARPCRRRPHRGSRRGAAGCWPARRRSGRRACRARSPGSAPTCRAARSAPRRGSRRSAA